MTISKFVADTPADLLLYGIGYAVAISVDWIQVVGRVVLWIGPIEVLLTIGYAAVVGVGAGAEPATPTGQDEHPDVIIATNKLTAWFRM